MGRMSGTIKWEKSQRIGPVNNIISSDFPKYCPQPWKFMDGPSRIGWLLSYEYQRMWITERDQWKKRVYPENTAVNVDIIKSYVLSFKNAPKPQKPEKKKPFTLKKFEGIGSKTSSKPSKDDKAMQALEAAKAEKDSKTKKTEKQE